MSTDRLDVESYILDILPKGATFASKDVQAWLRDMCGKVVSRSDVKKYLKELIILEEIEPTESGRAYKKIVKEEESDSVSKKELA